MSPAAVSRHRVSLVRVQAPPGWTACVLPCTEFPAPEAETQAARAFLRDLAPLLCPNPAALETFIRFSHLHLGGGAARLAANGRRWMPVMGLGVWPGRRPPTTWKLEELKDLAPEDKPPLLMDIVLRVTGPPETRVEALDTMLGLGTVVQFVVPPKTDLLAAAEPLLKTPIEDSSLQGFPFYVPLLEARSVAGAGARLDLWMCGAAALIRESPEDHGILLVGRSLDKALAAIGLAPEE